MKKLLISFLFVMFPVLLYAESALSFAPPPTDVSVIFLSNIFGIVDGVLHGTGSQIMGSIFGVFNAAVLALGGIVIMYTLMVSTVNTAHEGQLLGQKWSSIWVPVRSTLGLSLLIPKASGYCLMQTFFMWVVVQGVGAADKVWDAALSYLNRGGVIVQEQINPITSIMGNGMPIAKGAATILYGQTCMLGLEKILSNQRQGFLNRKAHDSGPCFHPESEDISQFCSQPVPDFLSSVNAVSYQNSHSTDNNFTLPMPNFGSSPFYANLNGICGEIKWNALKKSNLASLDNISALNTSEKNTAELSRAIAVQAMYTDLSLIAQIVVNNDPQLSPPTNSQNSTTANTAPFATQQFGIPMVTNGKPCPSTRAGQSNPDCTSWGPAPSIQSEVLFNGTEFQGAIADYNAIMLPTLTLIQQANNSKNANGQRAFITKASSEGWMLAGSYFFSLASINAANTTTTSNVGLKTPIDGNTGLGSSTFSTETLQKCVVCKSLGINIANITSLLNGEIWGVTKVNGTDTPSIISEGINAPSIPDTSTAVAPTLNEQTGVASSSVFGFVNNSLMVSLPGQPGVTPPNFIINIIPDFSLSGIGLPAQNFPCGKLSWVIPICFGSLMGDIFYNYIIRYILNFFISLVINVINSVVMAFLAVPLIGIAQIFRYGVTFIQTPGVNPIIALANMGINYINFASDLWIFLLLLGIATTLLGPVAIFIFALIMMVMPLLMAWLGVMVSIGFLTAYYIPFLPYMIFTFGTIAWLMAVVEAMVAAPIVALGITHPEGEGPFGKGEQAIMILMNIFLRPSLMIIGYIAGIILSYVSVWVINAGFSNVLPFLQGTGGFLGSFLNGLSATEGAKIGASGNPLSTAGAVTSFTASGGESGYTGWAGVYGFFFSILIYTTMYLTVVQKSFSLISSLPDKVLRWIGGGQPESAGQEAAQWAEEPKKQVESAATGTAKAQGQMGKDLGKRGLSQFQKQSGSGPSSTASVE